MRLLRILPAALLLTLVVPAGSASACAVPMDPDAQPVLENWYLRIDTSGATDRVQIWDEENGRAGLQTTDFSCGGAYVRADLRVADVPVGFPVITL